MEGRREKPLSISKKRAPRSGDNTTTSTNNPSTSFNEDFWSDGFKTAFTSGELSDLLLTELTSGKTFHLHKIILTRKSEFFEKLIVEDVHANSLAITDPSGCLECVLEYLYLGKINVQPTNVDGLLTAAEFYGIQGLTNQIMSVVQQQFSFDKDLIFLYLHYGEQSKIACAEYIRKNFTSLTEAGCFERLKCTDLSPKEFYLILTDEKLEVGAEHVVSTAVQSYLQKNAQLLQPEDITFLLSAVRFNFLTSQHLLKIYINYKNYLPPSWKESLVVRLCEQERIEIPAFLKLDPPRPSYAKGVAKNLLNHYLTGGTCKLVEYSFYNGVTAYNPGTLDAPPTSTWANNGCLIDDPLTQNDSNQSYRCNSSIGSTWTNGPQASGVGVLVVDLTQSAGTSRTLRRFNLFQMISDGATTSVQISAFSLTATVPPPYQDGGWFVILPWKDIGAASTVTNPPGADPAGNTVLCTNEFTTEPISTRFLKIELSNNGRNGSAGYIELRQIKAYAL